MQWTHIPIMAREIGDFLLTDPNGIYLDGTLGLGGHTAYFLTRLSAQAKIIGLDKDAHALEMAQARVNDGRLVAFHKSYTQAREVLAQLNLSGVHGALFDLGLSSYQLDDPSRGFSILHNGPLDMRFDTDQHISAADIVNTWGLDDLVRILTDYGEEPRAQQIALAIMRRRKEVPLRTTEDLKLAVEQVYGPKRGKTHPATQTFQALRIACNRELDCVRELIGGLEDIILPGGRAAILTFHSLEDRLVKLNFKDKARSGAWRLLTKHALGPAYEEIKNNRRARSAKLRVIERINA